MELSLLMKLRIAAVVAAGVILIGLCAWPLAAPPEPFGAVLAGEIGFGGTVMLAPLALLTGLLSFFFAWPYGREIGILAVPSGLAIWAARSGNMAGLIRLNPTVVQRQALFATLRWEPIFWLAIVAAGFLGVLLGRKISGKTVLPTCAKAKSDSKSNTSYLNAVFAFMGSVLIALFCIKILAQDVRDGPVVAQPAIGQIAFAALVSFGAAAFVFKKFFNTSYIWPIIASSFVLAFASIFYVKQDAISYLAQNWPAVFFSNAITAVLPIQMVAFGTLGSIAGYWLAVRYNYWREHEIK